MQDDPAPLTISVPRTAALLGVSRALVYKLITDGELPSLKIAGRRLVRIADINEYLARRVAAASTEAA